jgi:Fe-S cluster assembly protein SufD
MIFTELAEIQFANCLSAAAGPDRAFREKAWAEFKRQGLPSTKNEAWKYSSLAVLNKTQWSESTPNQVVPPAAMKLIRQWKDSFDIAVMINGQLQRKVSALTLESGYEFTALNGPSAFPEVAYVDGIVSLTAALHRGGYHLTVAPGISFPKPLLIIHCVQGDACWSSTLNRVHLGAGSRFQLAEVFVGGTDLYLHTDMTHVALEKSAGLDWVRIQQEGTKASHFSELQAKLASSSQFALTQVNGGAVSARSSVKVDIMEEFAEAHVNGLTFAREHQHIDQRVEINHLAGNSGSTQLFKGVLKDFSRGILNGKIHIARNAQKVNSSQLNHNLLLSSTAEADTKPELEIYADDVNANHGASVGRLDENKLFYLLSRAIPRSQAVQMLAQAFVGDVLMKVQVSKLRQLLSGHVESLLPDFAGQMETIK